MRHFYTRFLLPVGLLAGTIIGAGVFALPYAFYRSGIATGVLYLILGAALYTLLHLLYADVIVRTEGDHRFVGYARMYLGRFAGGFALLMTAVGMLFTLTIYLVLSVSFINFFLPEGAAALKILIFWALGSVAVFLNAKKLALSEFLVTLAIVAIIVSIFFIGAPQFFLSHISLTLSTNVILFLFPLAPILFALSGRVAIPVLAKYFKSLRDGHDYKGMRRAIIWGTCIPACLYLLFVIGVLGISHIPTEDAVAGLSAFLSPLMLLVLGILGFLSLWSSYIAVGTDTLASLGYDLKFSPFMRSLVVIAGPLILYFGGFTHFLKLVSLTGGIFAACEGILILLFWLSARKRAPSAKVFSVHPLTIALGCIILIVALVYESLAHFLW